MAEIIYRRTRECWKKKSSRGGAKYSTEKAQKTKEALIKTIGPVLAECYRNMTKDEFDDVCKTITLFGILARELIPATGPEALEKAIKMACQED